jgi:hypothetical protein
VPAVHAGQDLRRDAQVVQQPQAEVAQGAAHQAFAQLAAGGGAHGHGQDADSVPVSAQAGHELQVFHDRHGHKSAQFRENAFAHENGLVAVGHAGAPGAQVGGRGDKGQSRCAGLIAQAEGSAAERVVAQGLANESEGGVGQDRVGVQEKKNVTAGGGRSGVLLRPAAGRRSQAQDRIFFYAPQGVAFGRAVNDDDFHSILWH